MPTPAFTQIRDNLQVLQRGDTGLHMRFPKVTSKVLKMIQYCFGSIFRNAASVSWGCFVATMPSLFEILWT